MASFDDKSVMRRKLDRAPAPLAQASAGAEKSWPVVLARAARDAVTLGLDVQGVTQGRVSLAELLEMPPDRALIAVLEGPSDGLGLMAISAPLLAAMTEMQTIGRVSALAPALRKPTRTDAAMVAGFVDAALVGLETALCDDADLVWAGGFRYASFLADPRPLGLLLEDVEYRVLVAEILVEGGARAGQLMMALPAEGRGVRPRSAAHSSPETAQEGAFSADLADQVDVAHCVLQAVIHRMHYPLAAVMSLAVGDVLAMASATIDKVGFEGLDGQRVAQGRLGQNRGMRAVRVAPPLQAGVPVSHDDETVFDAPYATAAAG